MYVNSIDSRPPRLKLAVYFRRASFVNSDFAQNREIVSSQRERAKRRSESCIFLNVALANTESIIRATCQVTSDFLRAGERKMADCVERSGTKVPSA